MISIGDDVDRDADTCGRDNLCAGAVNGFDQPPTEFFGVFKITRLAIGRSSSAALIESCRGRAVLSSGVARRLSI
jgi:hypothetical protein